MLADYKAVCFKLVLQASDADTSVLTQYVKLRHGKVRKCGDNIFSINMLSDWSCSWSRSKFPMIYCVKMCSVGVTYS